MSEEKKVIFKHDGLVIRQDSIYKVIHKPDKNANTAFQEKGATKLPSRGVADTVGCRFVERQGQTGKGKFDTGLSETSPCYAHMDRDKVKKLVAKLHENIVEPYELDQGEEGILQPTNFDFWDNYGIRLEYGRVFNTNDPSDVLDLFIALNSHQLTPKHKAGAPQYVTSAYCIEDEEESRSIEEERASDFLDAVTAFGTLLKDNKTLLVALLSYVNVTGLKKKSSDDTIKPLFNQWVRQSDNATTFLDVYKDAVQEENHELYLTYYQVRSLVSKNTIERNPSGGYSYKGLELGKDFKSVAKNLVLMDEFKEIHIELSQIKTD